MPQLSSLSQVKEFQFWLFQSISCNEIRWEVCTNLEVDVQIEMEDKNAYLKTSVNIFVLVVNIPYFRGLFFLSGISFMTIYESQDYGGRGREFHFSNSSLPLPPASQTLRHQSSNCCREPTSAHRQQLDAIWEPFVSKRKSLTTKLRTLALFEV